MSVRKVLTAAERLDRTVSEAELFEACRQMLDLYGWLWYHTYDSRRSNPGFLDIVAVRDGVIRFIELKSQTGRISQGQLHWMTELGRAIGKNVYVHVWRPSDLSEITRILK